MLHGGTKLEEKKQRRMSEACVRLGQRNEKNALRDGNAALSEFMNVVGRLKSEKRLSVARHAPRSSERRRQFCLVYGMPRVKYPLYTLRTWTAGLQIT